MPLLHKAAMNFLASASADSRRELQEFARAHASWLDDFALFMALKEEHGLVAWTRWPSDIAARQGEAMKRNKEELASAIEAQKFFPRQASATGRSGIPPNLPPDPR